VCGNGEGHCIPCKAFDKRGNHRGSFICDSCDNHVLRCHNAWNERLELPECKRDPSCRVDLAGNFWSKLSVFCNFYEYSKYLVSFCNYFI
jgi:hypothetical protein